MSLFIPRKINKLGLAAFLAAVAFTLYAALAPGDDTAGQAGSSCAGWRDEQEEQRLPC